MPREQILGDAAVRRVPGEFIPQDITVMNPPTLLLLLENIYGLGFKAGLKRYKDLQKLHGNAVGSGVGASVGGGGSGGDGGDDPDEDPDDDLMDHETGYWIRHELVPALYPRAAAWLKWMLHSQAVRAPHPDQRAFRAGRRSFRWRGRDPNEDKLMPTTFASGLDDYPRALFPSDDEEHVDLTCWLIHASYILAHLMRRIESETVGELAVDLAHDTRPCPRTEGTFLRGFAFAATNTRDDCVAQELKGTLMQVHWMTPTSVPTRACRTRCRERSCRRGGNRRPPEHVATLGTDVVAGIRGPARRSPSRCRTITRPPRGRSERRVWPLAAAARRRTRTSSGRSKAADRRGSCLAAPSFRPRRNPPRRGGASTTSGTTPSSRCS